MQIKSSRVAIATVLLPIEVIAGGGQAEVILTPEFSTILDLNNSRPASGDSELLIGWEIFSIQRQDILKDAHPEPLEALHGCLET